MKNASEWTLLAIQYGPFFFSLLFCIFLTRWGYQIYNKANRRTDPVASKEEIRTYQRYFYVTFIIGIFLVLGSTIWWIFEQSSNKVYLFEGRIEDLNGYDEFSSTDLFLQEDPIGSSIDGQPTRKNIKFVFYQTKNPIKKNTRFQLGYTKKGGQQKTTYVYYNKELSRNYNILFNEKNGKYFLSPIKEKANHAKVPMHGFVLYAKPLYQISKQEFNYRQNYLKLKNPEKFLDMNIKILQNEYSDVGKKTDALIFLRNLDDKLFNNFIMKSTKKEPMILTILDLSRHTDKELSYLAKKIINERFQIDNYLKRMLLDANVKTRTLIEKILFRMEKKRVEKILNKITLTEKNTWIRNIEEDIKRGKKFRVLIPTGSIKGDRYYVKAFWDKKNESRIECLTNLFFHELIHNRTIEEERFLMKNKETRIVWWNSKNVALNVAKKIEDCGAKSEFIGFY